MNAMQPHPALVDGGTFPDGGTEEQIWEFLLRYAVRAPSGHNTQPWRFHIADGRLHVYADRDRALPVVDPEDRELVMSCGAALAHLTVALRHFGYAGDVSPFPDPAIRDQLATVGLGQAHTPRPGDHRLFEAIDNRHTHRAAFETRPVPHQLLAQLTRAPHQPGATLHAFTGDESTEAIATLVGEGDRTQFAGAGSVTSLPPGSAPTAPADPTGCPATPSASPTWPRCWDRR